MAGWSMLTNGSCSDIINGCKSSAYCSDVVVKDGNVVDGCVQDSEVRLRSLFDQVLSVFSDEAASWGCIRPFPTLLGNGESLDLFKLYQLVRKRGGFDMVSGFWNFVVKELGLDLAASASVKLVYFKYLYKLERRLKKRERDGRLANGQNQNDENVSCMSAELKLEKEFISLLSYKYKKRKDHKYKKNGNNDIVDVVKNNLGILDTEDVHKVCNGVGNTYVDDDEKIHDCQEKCSNNHDDKDDVVVLDPNIGRKIFDSRKRKRESLLGMLNWVIQIAKCPDDPSVGEMPPSSKWKEHKGGEFWAQVIRARYALLQRKQLDSKSEGSLLQNNQKMHPSMYEDVSDHSTERLRCSERLPALVKPRFCSCCNPCSSPQSKVTSPHKPEPENGPKEELHVMANDLSAANKLLKPSGEEHIERHALVGPRFQVEVPEWTGIVCESDPKWLGTQIWPSINGPSNDPIETDSIGKGRPNSCDCQLPGSVECVRFHIAENRVKLKLELGTVFYRWRFDRMGEETSLGWTASEEKRFKNMVRCSPPALGKYFWDNYGKYFPRKKREELVSYYFNVFLVQRRSYQNRVTPKHIDSDDDESEFGALGESYARKPAGVSGTKTLICSENKQCTDFR